MKNNFGKVFLQASVTVAVILAATPSFATANENSAAAHFKKVVWVIFENEDAAVVDNDSNFAKFATMGASFTNFFGEAHPSEPNYIAMIAGDNLGVSSDGNYNLSQSHIGDLLEKNNLDWHVYAEGYPGNCYTGGSYGKYARKHMPFISFTNVSKDAKRCAKITNEKTFFADLKAGTLPAFTMYVPDLNNDGHDTGVAYAGKWLAKNFGSVLSDPSALGDTLFILTFDESQQSNARNQIYTVLIGKNVMPGMNDQTLNHISLLRMIEDEYGLGTLGRSDDSAPALVNVWKN